MSADEQKISTEAMSEAVTEATATTTVAAAATEAVLEQERSEKILKAKELYSHGSRNYLVRSYAEAADELSQVCALYEELYGELSDELGMPYLLYAKSLIALALDENKVIDVPDQEGDDDDDEDEEDVDDEALPVASSSSGAANGNVAAKLELSKKTAEIEKKSDEADSTADDTEQSDTVTAKSAAQIQEEAQVSSSVEADSNAGKNGSGTAKSTTTAADAATVRDSEKPSTSNGEAANGDDDEEEEENEAASSLQLAWEILELAAKIFSRQGMSGLPNLAEVQTELANIEFENNILDAAREDYEKALKIYKELPSNYRRAMAEIHYKIGLTYLIDNMNKASAESLKEACNLIEAEIEEIKAKPEPSEKDKNSIQDMEETKEEIWAKIAEIEETQTQYIAEVRSHLDKYANKSENADGAGTSSASSTTAGAAATASTAAAASSAAITSSSKPTDISHLIKRKKPEEHSSEAEASPAKRPAV